MVIGALGNDRHGGEPDSERAGRRGNRQAASEVDSQRVKGSGRPDRRSGRPVLLHRFEALRFGFGFGGGVGLSGSGSPGGISRLPTTWTLPSSGSGSADPQTCQLSPFQYPTSGRAFGKRRIQ